MDSFVPRVSMRPSQALPRTYSRPTRTPQVFTAGRIRGVHGIITLIVWLSQQELARVTRSEEAPGNLLAANIASTCIRNKDFNFVNKPPTCCTRRAALSRLVAAALRGGRGRAIKTTTRRRMRRGSRGNSCSLSHRVAALRAGCWILGCWMRAPERDRVLVRVLS